MAGFKPRSYFLLGYLTGQITKGEALQVYPKREFVELKKRIPDDAASVPQPPLPESYMPTLSLKLAPSNDTKPPRVEALFGELSAQATARLVAK